MQKPSESDQVDALMAAMKASSPRGAMGLSVFELLALGHFARTLAAAVEEIIANAELCEVNNSPLAASDVLEPLARRGLYDTGLLNEALDHIHRTEGEHDGQTQA